ncbi:MAG TPA: putative selenium-dependent hydroxylase accessory protein YqeC, partial [Clostridiaceae bacterium]|nr:putative selenium-dependent hydroxylase accessory protein YqeC [Clostridiaceae bacterium]
MSFVGAGGKSSLMLALAKEEASEKSVIITTTTRIVPVENYISDKDKALEELRKRRIITLADPAEHGKLQYPGDDYFNRAIAAADLVLIEADGSKQLPLKFPATHEPVIHSSTQKIIIVMGLSALGRPFSDVCQRHQLAGEVIGIPKGEPVSMNTIEQLLIEGYLKPLSTLNLPLHVALNQADKITAVDVDEA